MLSSSSRCLRDTHRNMGAAKALSLRWTLPPAALLALSSGVLHKSGDRAHSDRQTYSTSATVIADNGKPSPGKPSNTNTNTLIGSEDASPSGDHASIWTNIIQKFDGVKQSVGTPDWIEIDAIKNYIIPDWARLLPATVQKLQRELSMAPGSLADDIWREAQDPYIHPEIAREARVRVGDTLCDEEVEFRQKRQRHAVQALASYLAIPEEDIHPEDVPIIAMCGSGGGLRALVAGTGSYLAAQEAGLWDCVTYTAGVSGSCWLQTLYHSSITGRDFNRMVDHLKSRLGVHMAFPPKALKLLTTAPTNKYLLAGLVEKLKGDPGADFGLVDIYGMLLAARLLVPKGELGVSDTDLKLSHQTHNLLNGAHPLPIYTAVRHEIPMVVNDEEGHSAKPMPETRMRQSQREAWFQWFEFTPYEFFCEELGAGIPTWALGRHFYGGRNKILPDHSPIPELRVPGLMGIWGSAFCATLSHYYKEIRPLVKGIAGFGGIDSLIQGKTKDLIRVHPIDPAAIPNYVRGMEDVLPPSCPDSIFKDDHLRLMDAGMSNNLPIYPLLRPGRDVDIIVSFDASADIKQENWLSVVDGYARQRGIKGWPVGAGWPKENDQLKATEETLREPQNISETAINQKMKEVQEMNKKSDDAVTSEPRQEAKERPASNTDLDYCNVWVGTTEEMVSGKEPPPSKRLFHPEGDQSESEFHLMRPEAGIAVVYFPLLPNPSAPERPPSSAMSKSRAPSRHSEITSSSESAADLAPHPASINPDVDDFLSTWNFIYTPEQIDAVVGLAKANFAQGEEQVKRVVRAVYERKKNDRLQREAEAARQRMEGFVPL
ncbi:FabD/lysophospholipase-like protein [Aspergillus floccosus]